MATRGQLEQQYIQDKAFWGSISSRWRGLAAGIMLGGIMGAVIGAASIGIFAAVTGTALATMVPAVTASILAFTAGGMFFGMKMWGEAGMVSGAISAALVAQKELDKSKNPELQKEVALDSSIKAAPDKKPLINWKVSVLGAVIAGGMGAFLAGTGLLPAAATYAMFGQTANAALATGLSFGALGTVFGVNFKPWQAFKKWSDGIFEGKVTGRTIPANGELKEQLLAATPEPEKFPEAIQSVARPHKDFRSLVAQQEASRANDLLTRN